MLSYLEQHNIFQVLWFLFWIFYLSIEVTAPVRRKELKQWSQQLVVTWSGFGRWPTGCLNTKLPKSASFKRPQMPPEDLSPWKINLRETVISCCNNPEICHLPLTPQGNSFPKKNPQIFKLVYMWHSYIYIQLSWFQQHVLTFALNFKT